METGMIDYHFSLGAYIRNNWGLWSGSELHNYFFARSPMHEDDMAMKIIKFYHDYLNGNNAEWQEWEKKGGRKYLKYS